MTCNHTSHCELYVHFAADPSLDLWKQHYCEQRFERCERYQRALKGESVPLTLLPNGKTLIWQRSDEENGIHALFNAIQKNRINMIQSILRTGLANVRGMTRDGCTPLMFAARVGNESAVDVLLEFGCDPRATNSEGKTALEIALHAGHTACADRIRTARETMPPVRFPDQAQEDMHAGKPEDSTGPAANISFLQRLIAALRRQVPATTRAER